MLDQINKIKKKKQNFTILVEDPIENISLSSKNALKTANGFVVKTDEQFVVDYTVLGGSNVNVTVQFAESNTTLALNSTTGYLVVGFT